MKARRKEIDRITNRHIARMLTELEDAGCPVVFRDSVKSKMQWLRADLHHMDAEKKTCKV